MRTKLNGDAVKGFAPQDEEAERDLGSRMKSGSFCFAVLSSPRSGFGFPPGPLPNWNWPRKIRRPEALPSGCFGIMQ